MTIIESIILGIIQGLTEFLPVSSSGHLVLFQKVLGINQPGNYFEVLVHLGTLASVIFVFYDDLKSIFFSLHMKETQTFILFIVIGTIPAIIIGFGFKDIFHYLFENVKAVGFALLFTGIILISSSKFKYNNKNLNWQKSIMIGFVQALAIIPGISRSGITICMALFLGLSPKKAARLSFLLAIPVISGAGLLTALNVDEGSQLTFSVAISGFISSFVIGIIALKWLLSWLEKGKFYYFSYYCFFIGLLTILI